MVYHIFKILSAFYYNTNFIAADPISNLTFIKIAERHKNTYLCTRSVMTEMPFNILFIKYTINRGSCAKSHVADTESRSAYSTLLFIGPHFLF